MKTYIPDVATKFKKGSSSFRVTHWLKAVPLVYKPYNGKGAEFMNDILHRLFLDAHPNWKTEYKLVYCSRDDATHVEGVGVAGCIVAVDSPDVIFTGVYVGWDEEQIDEARKQANNYEWLNDSPVNNTYVIGKQHTE